MKNLRVCTLDNMTLRRKITELYLREGLGAVYTDKTIGKHLKELFNSREQIMDFIFESCGLNAIETESDGKPKYATSKEILTAMVNNGVTAFYSKELDLLGKTMVKKHKLIEFEANNEEVSYKNQKVIDYLVNAMKSDLKIKKEFLKCKNSNSGCSELLAKLVYDFIDNACEIIKEDTTTYIKRSGTRVINIYTTEDITAYTDFLKRTVLYSLFYGSQGWAYLEVVSRLKSIISLTGNLQNACLLVKGRPDVNTGLITTISLTLLTLEIYTRDLKLQSISQYLKGVYNLGDTHKIMKTSERIVFTGNTDRTVTCFITDSSGTGAMCQLDSLDADKITSLQKTLTRCEVTNNNLISGKRDLWEMIYGAANPANGERLDLTRANVK